MRKHKPLAKMYLAFMLFCVSASLVRAQDVESPDQEKAPKQEKVVAEKSKLSQNKLSQNKPSQNKLPEKVIQSATLNLQTTVTGNQEQPRVLYILPWQSPAADDVDFESIDNEEKAVFGHVERDEFRRELESAGE
jgi:hypothetical protein